MKNKLIILAAVIAVLTYFTDCFPQNADSIQRGSLYSITLVSGKTVQGKVMSADSVYVLLKTNLGLDEIERKNILTAKKLGQKGYSEYFTTYKKPSYRKYISYSIGYISPSVINDNYEYSYGSANPENLNNGFSITAAYSGFFSRGFGVRAALSYTGISNKDDSIYYYYGSSTFRKGGSMSQYVIGMDMLAGMFHPEKKLNLYAAAGFGIGIANCGEVTETYAYGGEYNFNPEPQFLFSYGIGGGITYRISEKTGVQTELYYNHISLQEGFYRDMNQFVIKAGIVLF